MDCDADIVELEALMEEIRRRFPDDGSCLGTWFGRIIMAVDQDNAARAALAGFEAGMRVKFLQACPLASREARRQKGKKLCDRKRSEKKAEWHDRARALFRLYSKKEPCKERCYTAVCERLNQEGIAVSRATVRTVLVRGSTAHH